ncbi:MAG: RNase adapter RapZ [Rhodobacteraceae bacterium]|nr:RNase adapter RapZ [Paracoccaceae bacterium]
MSADDARSAFPTTGLVPTASESAARRVVLVTGPAGAGRSTAIGVLEDIGFEAVDNLPLSLLSALLAGAPEGRSIALGVDARNRDFAARALIENVDVLARDPGLDATLLYLDCRPEVLLRRFSETRRRHPLGPGDGLQDAIAQEIDLLEPLRTRADVLIDTSELSPNDLRTELRNWFAPAGQVSLSVSVQSFSYRRGLPNGVDMILDCRFLANPHWEPLLRPRDGRDAEVQAHVAADPLHGPFFRGTLGLVEMLLPAYLAEGKAHFTIAFGCTGGRHRSVALAETMAKSLAQDGWQVSIRHRELERHAPGAGAAG